MTPAPQTAGNFWIGSEPESTAVGTQVRGPLYVEWEKASGGGTQVVLIHGGGGQGTDWTQTPDGRPGWAPLLREAGHDTYVVDRPGHGRSALHPAVLGEMLPPMPLDGLAGLFTPEADAHPFAGLHTQWPSGEEAFNQFAASSGPLLADFEAAHRLEGERGAALLDKIGPAVLMTHSAGGPAGWMIAAARPDLVKAIVAVDPMGPPFLEIEPIGKVLKAGLTAAEADLSALAEIPIAIVTGEATVFKLFDEATLGYLVEQGCKRAELLRLEDHGVKGNGHGVMLEANNAEALAPIVEWIAGATS